MFRLSLGENLFQAGISLMVGLTALAACFIAENLRVIGTSLFSHWFART